MPKKAEAEEDIWQAFDRVLTDFDCERACMWPGDEELLEEMEQCDTPG